MDLLELCEKIELQDEMTQSVMDFSSRFDFSPLENYISGLTDEKTSVECYKAISSAFGDDERGIKILTCYLKAALITYDKYQRLGIADNFYFDTMKCFPRFIGESLECYGKLCFTHAYWSYRQLNTTLIRIGTLEYECCIMKGERVISVHIPSNADLDDLSLDRSIADARKFIRKYFPQYGDAPMVCESWLMFKGLYDLVQPGSRILKFQERFDVISQTPATDGQLIFIFKRDSLGDYKDLPENTSLQRNMKQFLLNGGRVDIGYGTLRENK